MSYYHNLMQGWLFTKRRNKTQQLDDFISVVTFSLIKKAMNSKQVSRHTSKPCLKVHKELAFNLAGERWLEGGLIDNSGYHYNFSVLTAEQLCELADHI